METKIVGIQTFIPIYKCSYRFSFQNVKKFKFLLNKAKQK